MPNFPLLILSTKPGATIEPSSRERVSFRRVGKTQMQTQGAGREQKGKGRHETEAESTKIFPVVSLLILFLKISMRFCCQGSASKWRREELPSGRERQEGPFQQWTPKWVTKQAVDAIQGCNLIKKKTQRKDYRKCTISPDASLPSSRTSGQPLLCSFPRKRSTVSCCAFKVIQLSTGVCNQHLQKKFWEKPCWTKGWGSEIMDQDHNP